ncbi:MAG: HNH endonuclease [Bacteroides sp.]|nr:HNH endonuclease [Eubacterium sp.]MCM1419223.1 HNH endonuclease [Roseburia sp.]MCM1463461.1 HNH endonuclease [Bacteroides sp.]
MSAGKVTYVSEIINALNQLDGAASLKEINEAIERNSVLPSILTNPNWSKNVSAEIQRHCSATKSYRGAEDLFYPVYGLGEGYWGLNSKKDAISNLETSPIEERQVKEVENDITLLYTEKEQIILARRGQGMFRDQLIKKYKACVVTGIEEPKLLVASHIKPWRNATEEERLSTNNGLLLSMLYDKLFDTGLITFKTTGYIAISSKLSEHDKSIIGIDITHKYLHVIPYELRKNIEYHNEYIFIK